MDIPNNHSNIRYDVLVFLKDNESPIQYENAFMQKYKDSKDLFIIFDNGEDNIIVMHNMDYVVKIGFKHHKES